VNSIERKIYDLVKSNPKIKNWVRDIYQRFFSFIPVKQIGIENIKICKPGFFFGFHDKSPWSFDDRYLLANKFSIPNRKINSSDSIEVGYFKDEDCNQFQPLAKTNSFNWQQGCMLQWVGKKNEIIFNSFDGRKHVSKVLDLSGKELKEFPLPIGAVSPDGKFALSYSFSRMAKYAPGYGYENLPNDNIDDMIPKGEGLSIVDLETQLVRKLFTINEIVAIDFEKSMENAHHYFTHCLFSPSGNKFVFYHRWIKNLNFVKTRMISCDLDGSNKFIFPTNGMVSHIGWKDDKRIMAYCSTKEFGDAYTLFEIDKKEYFRIGEGSFTSDGHPSFSPIDNNFFITDTYPDKFRLSSLFLFDCDSIKRYDLARLKQPMQFKQELRCDLHPRWNRAGTSICFDSAHRGKRALCVIKLDESIY
jgi:hypothetical protein